MSDEILFDAVPTTTSVDGPSILVSLVLPVILRLAVAELPFDAVPTTTSVDGPSILVSLVLPVVLRLAIAVTMAGSAILNHCCLGLSWTRMPAAAAIAWLVRSSTRNALH